MTYAKLLEPKTAHRRQQPAFLGDPAGQNEIESTDPIGADDQQRFAEIVDIAHLPAAAGKGQSSLQQGAGVVKFVQVCSG